MIKLKEFLETDIYNYLLQPLIYIIVAYCTYKIITIIINKALRNNSLRIKNQKRLETSKSIINNGIKYVIIILTFLIILSLYHIDVSKIFAGLGIGVAVLSLAFQDIAKDFLAGLSIVLENQFEIGDNVSINGFRGEVIAMGLKTTRIRDYKGAVQIISNHSIQQVINYSLSPSLAVVDIAVSYESDLDEVEKVIDKTIQKINTTYQNLKGKAERWGVQELADSAVIYRVAVKVKATKDFETERQMKREFKLAFDEANIKIPYSQIEVHYGQQ